MFEYALDLCTNRDASKVSTLICYQTFAIWGAPIKIAIWAKEDTLIQEETRYKKEVEDKDAEYQTDLLESTYENVNKNHGNIITTFKQLKLVAQKLNTDALRDFEKENRNLQLFDCNSTVSGFKEHCDKPSCEDQTRLCDGSWNYRYIAILEGGEFSTAYHLLSNSIIKLHNSDSPFL